MSRVAATLPLVLLFSVSGWAESLGEPGPAVPTNSSDSYVLSSEFNPIAPPDDLTRRVENLEIRMAELDWKIMETEELQAIVEDEIKASRAKMNGVREIISRISLALSKAERDGSSYPRSPETETLEILGRKGFLRSVVLSSALISSEAEENLKGLQAEMDRLRDEEIRWHFIVDELREEKDMITRSRLQMEIHLAEPSGSETERAARHEFRDGVPLSPGTYPLNPMLMPAEAGHQEIDTNFEGMKGILEWPVNGEILRARQNGDADSGDGKRGIEIDVSPLSPVRPVYWGRVIYAGELRGYGNLLIIDHGNHYYTVYSNIEIEGLLVGVGEVVSPNWPIARAGIARNGRPIRIYFGIRHYGEVIDPLDWLSSPKAALSRSDR